ncbi:MAG: hypothetical protein G01um10148_343 [Parcubacteria group bacterium Gr01-1014_8]|nr:MAG: hypothetical protein G01um10148_343 [Parcubacteria group bacterium Gr01-1014_8]
MNRLFLVVIVFIAFAFMGWQVWGDVDPFAECTGVHRNECLGAVLKEMADVQGIAAAFESFTELYDEPDFTKDCHPIVHEMGKGAYERYKRGKPLEAVHELSYCSYGFYHGFLEAMVPDTGDPKKARELCDKLQDGVTDGRSVIGPCLHGFGHGVTDGTRPERWGSFETMSEPSLEICSSIARRDDEKMLCAGGVFNAISIMSLYKKNGLVIDKVHPYAPCEKQTDVRVREACFRNFHPTVSHINHEHFLLAAHQVEALEKDADAIPAMENLAIYQSRRMTEEYTDPYIAAFCHRVQPRLQNMCVEGFAVGFLIFGTPGEEYERALTFCQNTELRGEHEEHCLRRVIQSSKQQYSRDVYKKVCMKVPRAFQYLCEEPA